MCISNASRVIVCGLGIACCWAGFLLGTTRSVCGHEGIHARPHHEGNAWALHKASRKGGPDKGEANQYFKVFTSLVANWPLPCREELIAQATREHQFIHDDPMAPDLKALRSHRGKVLSQLTSLVPTFQIEFQEDGAKLLAPSKPISVCPGMSSLVLIKCVNSTRHTFVVRPKPGFNDQSYIKAEAVPPNRLALLSYTVLVENVDGAPEGISIQIENREGEVKNLLSIPIQVVKPAKLQLSLTEGMGTHPQKIVPGRITVQCSDGVCRHGGRYAKKSTFTDKPIIYPPIGTWQKLPFFYSDQMVEMEVPPGSTRVSFERGFEHRREIVELTLKPDGQAKIERSCKRLIDMFAQDWVSGDTHVHWVTNAWNVDEPLELLSMAQRAEDLRVANNLTLLQRYANQAFVKPSQAPMGPVPKFSGNQFHVQMAEEYRNENLYGHLCLLNIDWLVQPIGTGSIIAGPDALDYPINRNAIEACRIQGGISIEAHGTGGNKDVPVNVIHNLTDSLDQMEPEMYYLLLDCGFKLPLTNGSDHPARPLGVARAYVKIDGEFSYDRWIDGIRNGRTFTTSGPLIFLEVNDSNIGDVIFTGRKEKLRVKAKAISRDPIGTFQIVSNGKVLFSRDTKESKLEVEFALPAEESRWIVARCSNRKDGRADFGFGNFNVITGPGIAHTSPVYVQVDGVPRFDPAAAEYWRERMRLHSHDIRGRGRFADESQRKEAVGYIENGIEMFLDLKSQVKLSRSKSETYSQSKRRLANVIRRFGKSESRSIVLNAMDRATSFDELQILLAPLTLLKGVVKSKSQSILSASTNRIQLMQGRPQRFLISIENQIGVEEALRLDAYELEAGKPKIADWCSVEVLDSPFTSSLLTGAAKEFKVVELVARTAGEREIYLAAKLGGNVNTIGLVKTDKLSVDVKPRSRSGKVTGKN